MERRYSAVDIGSRRVLAPKSFGSQHKKDPIVRADFLFHRPTLDNLKKCRFIRDAVVSGIADPMLGERVSA